MDRLPSLDVINKLSNDCKLNEEKNNKSDCEYMMNLIVETFDKAKKSNSTIIVSTNINESKLYNVLNSKMTNCKFGPNNESINTILKSKDVNISYIKNYYNDGFCISYDKLSKKLFIVTNV
jgi:hypothetical protein